jgi:carbamoyltransferase
MRVAGLHFGHDAGGATVEADGLTRFLDKERRSKVKHALGLSTEDLKEALEGADAVGLSSTQDVPMFFTGDVEAEFAGARRVSATRYFQILGPEHHYQKYIRWMGDLSPWSGVQILESRFSHLSRLNDGFHRSYEALSMVAGQFPAMGAAMSIQGQLRLDGRSYRARFYQHHFLHAQYAAFAATPSEPALIISGDGGIGQNFAGGGIYFWTPGQKLLPVTPVDGWLGQFYDTVAGRLGLGTSGGAGKLMGLAPYGRPIYYEPGLVGSRYQVTDGYRHQMADLVDRWIARDVARWEVFTSSPPPFVADVAASAQLILERNIQELTSAAVAIAKRAGFNFKSIVLTGGLALNCPANSNLAVTFDVPVLAPPAVNDEGLSIGAAIAMYFDETGAYPRGPKDYSEAAYIGTEITVDEVIKVATARGWTRCGGVAEALNALLADELVGICVGRSEVGPRALGHRSILANPGSTKTWAAANRLKRREPWRPFAPAVLQERTSEFFDRGPEVSRFMLFNFRCTTKALPAITHYDHSSRIQQVSPETGLLYDLLKGLEAKGAPPVVMNTSFNGPGVPIVDTADDALAEAEALGLNLVLTEGGLFRAPTRA